MTIRNARILPAAVLAAVALSSVAALPSGSPESLGLSTPRLHRIADLIQRYIDDHQISGAVTVVARRGQVAYEEAQGLMDIEAKTPMRKDAIFRMASMSKPVTGVAIMMLVEEGKVRLTDPVSRFIPEFKNMQVAMPKPGARPARAAPGAPRRDAEIYTVPADREITVRDLLTHTSGLESSGIGYRTATRMAPRRGTMNLAQYVPTLGKTPLDFQPGTRWRYSLLAGMETLGRIVEVASGETFDRFLQERIFGPLGMTDTSFVVPEDKKPRIVTLYDRTDQGTLERAEAQTPGWLNTTTLFSGGGGLYSTAADYMAFAQMLANGGELNGKRLLGRRTVQLMASNHVGDLYGPDAGRPDGLGFGLAMEVVLDPVAANTRRGRGSFGWGGAFGTYFWVDPENDIVALLMIQTPVNALREDFANAVSQAIVQ
jgi:CubicO group peptidase (beta-lactamase class C family)